MEPAAPPFRIVGEIYYVGTTGLPAFLVAGPAGHVLIDGGLPERTPLILASIRRLGFRLPDVRNLLLHHAHYDLAEKRARLQAGHARTSVDPAELARQVDRAEAGFRAELARQRGSVVAPQDAR